MVEESNSGKSADTKKSAWTAEEDQLLAARIAKYGTKSWTVISAGVASRSAKSCRLRWCNQLHPDVKKAPFSEWEQAVVVKAQEVQKNKWAALARMLPGRTDNAIKNHWNATLCRKLNNPDEPLNNRFLEQGVTLEWLLAHPELDTSQPSGGAAAASKLPLLSAPKKGIRKKKQRKVPAPILPQSPDHTSGQGEASPSSSSRPAPRRVSSSSSLVTSHPSTSRQGLSAGAHTAEQQLGSSSNLAASSGDWAARNSPCRAAWSSAPSPIAGPSSGNHYSATTPAPAAVAGSNSGQWKVKVEGCEALDGCVVEAAERQGSASTALPACQLQEAPCASSPLPSSSAWDASCTSNICISPHPPSQQQQMSLRPREASFPGGEDADGLMDFLDGLMDHMPADLPASADLGVGGGSGGRGAGQDAWEGLEGCGAQGAGFPRSASCSAALWSAPQPGSYSLQQQSHCCPQQLQEQHQPGSAYVGPTTYPQQQPQALYSHAGSFMDQQQLHQPGESSQLAASYSGYDSQDPRSALMGRSSSCPVLPPACHRDCPCSSSSSQAACYRQLEFSGSVPALPPPSSVPVVGSMPSYAAPTYPPVAARYPPRAPWPASNCLDPSVRPIGVQGRLLSPAAYDMMMAAQREQSAVAGSSAAPGAAAAGHLPLEYGGRRLLPPGRPATSSSSSFGGREPPSLALAGTAPGPTPPHHQAVRGAYSSASFSGGSCLAPLAEEHVYSLKNSTGGLNPAPLVSPFAGCGGSGPDAQSCPCPPGATSPSSSQSWGTGWGSTAGTTATPGPPTVAGGGMELLPALLPSAGAAEEEGDCLMSLDHLLMMEVPAMGVQDLLGF